MNWTAVNKKRFRFGQRVLARWSTNADGSPEYREGVIVWPPASWKARTVRRAPAVRVRIDDDFPDTNREFNWASLRTQEEVDQEMERWRVRNARKRLGAPELRSFLERDWSTG